MLRGWLPDVQDQQMEDCGDKDAQMEIKLREDLCILNYALMLRLKGIMDNFKIRLQTTHTRWLEYLNNLGMPAPYASPDL